MGSVIQSGICRIMYPSPLRGCLKNPADRVSPPVVLGVRYAKNGNRRFKTNPPLFPLRHHRKVFSPLKPRTPLPNPAFPHHPLATPRNAGLPGLSHQ